MEKEKELASIGRRKSNLEMLQIRQKKTETWTEFFNVQDFYTTECCGTTLFFSDTRNKGSNVDRWEMDLR